jgi:hypothetical protein
MRRLCRGIGHGSGRAWCLVAVSLWFGGQTVALAAELGASGRRGFDGAATGLAAATVKVGEASGIPGQTTSVGVTLDTGGLAVAGLQMNITFSPFTPIAAGIASTPDCTVNPSINKNLSGFAFVDKTTISAVVAGFNLDPIPDGALLFNCTVAIDLTAPFDVYPLDCSNPLAADPTGSVVPSTCTAGTVTVMNPTVLVDHYKCYEGKDLRNPELTIRTVDTSDQIGREPLVVQKLSLVCSPVDKNGEGIQNQEAHLACYQVKGQNIDPAPRVLVSTQFDQTNFALRKPRLLCVPATKTFLP